MSQAVENAPQTVRALVRGDELWLVLLAAVIGVAAGLIVVAMNSSTQLLREAMYGLAPGERLSAQTAIPPWCALIPACGGMLMAWWGSAWRAGGRGRWWIRSRRMRCMAGG